MLEMKLREHVNYASSQSRGVCSLSTSVRLGNADSDRANHRTFRYHTVFLRALFLPAVNRCVPERVMERFLRGSGSVSSRFGLDQGESVATLEQ